MLFLDDDIVVKKDLTALWSLDLKGNVNGAVKTCGERFHHFDQYLNFSNPHIPKNFDPHACGWAYEMSIFDLDQWKRQNITGVYYRWQKLVMIIILDPFAWMMLLSGFNTSVWLTTIKMHVTPKHNTQ